MYLSRLIDSELSKWGMEKNPKPLLLRGARQVGKTQTVKNLGKSFDHFIEINFESDKTVHRIFEGNLSAKEITENLSAVHSTEIKEGTTLLFFDEIQTCIPAIQALRFFYEQMPGLHVVAAGSLLEFALTEIPSFGVGRIRSVFMYPFSFDEFLVALGEHKLLELKKKANTESPLNEALHEKLLKLLRKFFLMGGMPEVIALYVQEQRLQKTQLILNDLRISYSDDFAKYKDKIPPQRIRQVFESVARQTGAKFVYSNILSEDNHRQLKEALDLLILAGIVIPVTHTSANGIPLGAEANPKKRKMIPLDTGLFLNILGFDISKIIYAEDFTTVNKGSLAEVFVGLELLKYASAYERTALYYWHREKRGSNAELDYIIQQQNEIVPVEIKSGEKGSMKSLNAFLESKKVNKGIRVSSGNFSKLENISIMPLYAISNLFN